MARPERPAQENAGLYTGTVQRGQRGHRNGEGRPRKGADKVTHTWRPGSTSTSSQPSPHPSPRFHPISSPSSRLQGVGHTSRGNNSRQLYSHVPPRHLRPRVWNSITRPQRDGSAQIHFAEEKQRQQMLSEIRPSALRERKGGDAMGRQWGMCRFKKYTVPVVAEHSGSNAALPSVCQSISLTLISRGG